MFIASINLKRLGLFASVSLLLILAFGCKKDKQPAEDPKTLPVVTTMQYFLYDGQIYNSPPYYHNGYITNDLGLRNGIITINGHNFSQDYKDSKVLFNNLTAKIYIGDSTKISVVVPDELPTGEVTLTIVTNGKTYVHPSKFLVKDPTPQITGISSEAGMRGSRVVITGKEFSTTAGKTSVTVNGIAATVDSTTLSAVYLKIPANATSGKLALTTYGKTIIYNNDFKIVSSTFTTINNIALKFISFDGSGNIYGTDDNKILKISPAGVATTITRIGNDNGLFGRSGTVFGGSTADASGNVYFISPYQANPVGLVSYPDFTLRLTKVLPDGTSVTIAGGGFPGYVDGQGTIARFNIPSQVAIDPLSGNFYINDLSVVRKVTPAGMVSTVANTRPAVGAVTMPNLKGIGPITVQSTTGDFYTIDVVAGYVGKITPAGVISTFPFTFALGSAPVNNQVGAAGLAVDATGVFYFSIGSSLYQLKNSVATNIYANPTVGNIISIAADKTGNIYLSAVENFINEPYPKYSLYKVTP